MKEKSGRKFFFAGGGTGGHIYPAIAVARSLEKKGGKVCFFCSNRAVDISILSKTQFNFIPLAAKPFGANPAFIYSFIVSFFKALFELLKAGNCVVIGVGGFVAAPVAFAAKCARKPLVFINVDAVPGKANRFLARFASEIFVQFESTKDKFGSGRFEVIASGCPLREEFYQPPKEDIRKELKLHKDKRIILVTGASSGAQNLNTAMELIMPKLSDYKDRWQVVHISGAGKSGQLQKAYADCGISACILEYCEKMPQLLNITSLAIARCGAVSVAEFMATATPAICLPYPYHSDNHQKLNAEQMQACGGAIIITDHKDNHCQTAEELWNALENLLKQDSLISQMRQALQQNPRPNAANLIAQNLMNGK